jgi:hypothetical protein
MTLHFRFVGFTTSLFWNIRIEKFGKSIRFAASIANQRWTNRR